MNGFPSERMMSDVIISYRAGLHLVEEGLQTPYGLATIVSVEALDSAIERGEHQSVSRPEEVDILIDLTLKLEREEDEIQFLKGGR